MFNRRFFYNSYIRLSFYNNNCINSKSSNTTIFSRKRCTFREKIDKFSKISFSIVLDCYIVWMRDIWKMGKRNKKRVIFVGLRLSLSLWIFFWGIFWGFGILGYVRGIMDGMKLDRLRINKWRCEEIYINSSLYLLHILAYKSDHETSTLTITLTQILG